MPESGGGGAGEFGRIVNPIPTGEGRLSPPITTGTPNVFHLPASLYLSKNSKKSKRKEWQAWSVITIDRVAWYQILLSSLCARLATLDDFGTVSKPCQPVWRGAAARRTGEENCPVHLRGEKETAATTVAAGAQGL